MIQSNVSTGGAGYNLINGKYGRGRVAIPTRIPFRTTPYPWPYPESAYQGAVGGSGSGKCTVSRPKGPYYSPFTQPYLGNWPWKENRQGWLNGYAIPVHE